jgi:cytochrome c biogenesis protein CcmG/thiol:disulfide interchange protein DsbE
MVTVKRLLGAVAIAALAACAAGKSDAGAGVTASVGQPAPNWTEPLAPSGTLTLASLRGKAVYLNFFATWCPPCNEEAPALVSLQSALGGKGLQIVGVDVLENARKAQLFRQEHRLNYPTVVDSGVLRDQYAVNGLPVHVFIDRTGVVRKIVVGELSASEMRRDVARILQ